MPSYELTVVFKVLPKEELFNAVKRTASLILSNGGVLRKLDSMGVNIQTPFKLNAHGKSTSQASYFVYTIDCPSTTIAPMRVKYSLDVDILRTFASSIKPEEKIVCSLDDELKPAPYRSAVKKIVDKYEKKKARKVKFPLNTGVPYNPLS